MPRRKIYTPSVTVPEYRQHKSRINWLMDIAAFLKQLSLEVDDLMPLLLEPLRDLTHEPCFSTKALATMLNLERLNLDILVKEKPLYTASGPRPKIDLVQRLRLRGISVSIGFHGISYRRQCRERLADS
jgi:hypothetical protein